MYLQLGKNIEQETVIVDIENTGVKHMWKPAINLYTEMVKMVEDNYPERLKMVLVVNGGYLIRTFMTELRIHLR